MHEFRREEPGNLCDVDRFWIYLKRVAAMSALFFTTIVHQPGCICVLCRSRKVPHIKEDR
jgi:hypothetical protein